MKIKLEKLPTLSSYMKSRLYINSWDDKPKYPPQGSSYRHEVYDVDYIDDIPLSEHIQQLQNILTKYPESTIKLTCKHIPYEDSSYPVLSINTIDYESLNKDLEEYNKLLHEFNTLKEERDKIIKRNKAVVKQYIKYLEEYMKENPDGLDSVALAKSYYDKVSKIDSMYLK